MKIENEKGNEDLDRNLALAELKSLPRKSLFKKYFVPQNNWTRIQHDKSLDSIPSKLASEEQSVAAADSMRNVALNGTRISSSPSGLNTEPEPLRNWTQSEQKVLIDSLNLHPQARDNAEYRRKLATRTQAHLHNKSADEIEECFKHLQAIRIAYCRTINSPKTIGKGRIFNT